MKEFLDSEEFYQLMQDYRNAPFIDQAKVVKAFEDVKQAIQVQARVSPKVAVEYKDGWIILLKQGDITISYPKSDVKQFIEDLSRALNGERLSTLH